MGTILTFILIIIVVMIFRFVKDSVQDTNRVAKEGGIYNKYRTLIDNFIETESGMKIIEKSNKYMCVGMVNSTGSIVFHFQHTFDKINVTFEMKNVFIGEHRLDWTFPETMPQTDMIRHIENRTRQYMENVTSHFR